MPKKKPHPVGLPVRFRDTSRVMKAHESMVDLISGRHSGGSFLDVFASGLLGLDIFRGLDEEMEKDIIYSDVDDDDDDDDDEEEEDDHLHPPHPIKPLEPHPRIRQLTDEEAEKHAKELIEEEERRKDRTEKNKKKKMRKKQKKRQEKENAVKDTLAEEEQGKSDSSENPEENQINESKADVSESAVSGGTVNEPGGTLNGPEVTGCDGNEEERLVKMSETEEEHGNKEERLVKTSETEEEHGNKEERLVKTSETEEEHGNKEERLVNTNKSEEEQQENLDLNNSYAESAPETPAKQQSPETEADRGNGESAGESAEDHPAEDVEKKAEAEKNQEETPETIKEKTVDATAEQYAKRSRELAGIGNRLAASGQYEMAVKCFTDAIKYNPKEFKLFGNRSLCYERMQQCENALRDADLALCMEPNWIKGLFRKGKALCGLKRYYEASLVYKEVLKLDSTSMEASQELKRALTLHLMEMGFSWAQSSEALKAHATLEEAVEALFSSDPPRRVSAARVGGVEQPAATGGLDGTDQQGQWTVLQTSRPRRVQDSQSLGESRSSSQSPTPDSRTTGRPELFPIWVGSLAPAVNYALLHELFSRAGTVHSIKMLLEQQCAFVNYSRKEDCDRAIQCLNGMVVEGSPLSVRYPNKLPSGLGMSRMAATDTTARSTMYKKECFFWRTSGCTRQDCTFRHVPEHKNIDKDKFTSRPAANHM